MEKGTCKEKILRCYKKLVESDIYTAIDECFSKEVLTIEEKEKLETLVTPSDKNRQLLKILLHKSEDTLTTFIECLIADHGDIRTLITETDTKRPFAKDRRVSQLRRQIFCRYDDIVQVTSLKDVIDDFISDRIFEIDEWEKITNTHLSTTEQNRKFLNTLLNKERGYRLLLSTLKRLGHRNLVTQIEATKVNENVDKEIERHLQKLAFENIRTVGDSGEIPPGKLLSWIEDDEAFCPIKATNLIYNEALHKGNVIVSGLPGAGKSANIHHIALRLKREGYRLCCVQGIKEMVDKIDKFGREEKQVYVFDDVFGVHGVDEIKRKQWSDENKDDIERCLRKSNIAILCSSRLQVVRDDKLSAIISKFCVINISQGENDLSADERVAIFRKHASAAQRESLLTEKFTEKIRRIECPVGCFPLVCRLYSRDKETEQSVEEYFDKPLDVIAENLEKLRIEEPLRHCCLLMCLIYDNSLPANTIEIGTEEEKTRNEREELLELYELHTSTSRQTIKKKMETLLKTYVKIEDGIYHFMHDIIYDAVIQNLSNLTSSFHKVILRHCSHKFVCDRVRLSTVDFDDSEFCINIRPDVYTTWGERILQILHEGICESESLHEDTDEELEEEDEDEELDEQDSLHQDTVEEWSDEDEEIEEGWDNNPRIDVFYNPCVLTEEGDKVIAELLSKRSPSYIKSLMCVEGCLIPGYGVMAYRHTALHWAVWCGMKYVVKSTLKTIPEIQLRKVHAGYNLLSLAFDGLRYDKDIIETLNLHGVDINKADIAGHTLLGWAVYSKDYKKSEYLINHGADVNQFDKLYGESYLYSAVCNKDQQMTSLLIKHGADINQCDKTGKTPLMQSLSIRDYQFCELLINHGADVNKSDNLGQSPLCLSVYNGDFQLTDLLIKHGADVNQCKQNDMSPLFVSVNRQHYQITELLIHHGADLNQPDQAGEFPLFLTVRDNDHQTTKLLIKHGAHVNKIDKQGQSPLHVSVCNNDDQITELLINHGADINLSDKEGKSPLYVSAEHGYYETAELLLNHGADVNLPNRKGQLPLFRTVRNKDYRITNLLIKHGSYVNKSDKDGQSVLYLSVCNSDYQITELLVKHGADVKLCETMGESLLYVSVDNNDLQTTELLLKHGGNVNQCDKFGMSPLYLSELNASDSISNVLMSHGALCIYKGRQYNNVTEIPDITLQEFLQRNNNEAVKHCLSKGVNVNQYDESGMSPLYVAVCRKDCEISELLIQHGADVNMCANNGNSPLYQSVYNKDCEITKLLILHGAIVNQYGKGGKSPLHCSVYNNDYQITKLLLEHGADVNEREGNGRSVLWQSVNDKDYQTTELLIKHGADVNGCISHGRPALWQSVYRKDYKTTELLLKHGALVNSCKVDGRSPLWQAVYNKDVQTTELLISKGADKNKRDKWGQSPLSLSIQNQDTQIMKLLNTSHK